MPGARLHLILSASTGVSPLLHKTGGLRCVPV